MSDPTASSPVAIVGAGAVGTALARGSMASGRRIEAVLSRGRNAAQALADRVGASVADTVGVVLPTTVRLVILCVPDDAVASVAEALAGIDHPWPDAIAAHASGPRPPWPSPPAAWWPSWTSWGRCSGATQEKGRATSSPVDLIGPLVEQTRANLEDSSPEEVLAHQSCAARGRGDAAGASGRASGRDPTSRASVRSASHRDGANGCARRKPVIASGRRTSCGASGGDGGPRR